MSIEDDMKFQTHFWNHLAAYNNSVTVVNAVGECDDDVCPELKPIYEAEEQAFGLLIACIDSYVAGCVETALISAR